MILVVSYDFKTVMDRTPFYDALKAQGAWWHYLASTWLISTEKTPEQVVLTLQVHLSSHDFLLVTIMGEQFQGLLPKEAWDWINTQTAASRLFIPPHGNIIPGLSGKIGGGLLGGGGSLTGGSLRDPFKIKK